MTFDHLLLTSVPCKDRLLEHGFKQNNSVLTLRTELDDEFYAIISFDSCSLKAEVFEYDSGDKYTLVDVKSANGEFVSGLRNKLCTTVQNIVEKCFISDDIKSKYVSFLENELGIKGEYPWKNDNSSAVYRCESKKWFALVTKIKFKNLGFDSDDNVWIVNLKTDTQKISELIDKKSVFPAWHMNKKHWITVVLTAVTDINKLKLLTLRSKELVDCYK